MKSLRFRKAFLAASCAVAIFLITTPSSAQEGWTAQNSGVSGWLNGIHYIDFDTRIAVGDAGVVITTTDAGATWTTQSTGVTSNLNEVVFVNQIGHAVGDDGVVIRSTDLGLTWAAQISGTIVDLLGVSFATAGHGIVVGAGGTMLRTTDGGDSWDSLASVTSEHLRGVSMTSVDDAFVVGDGGIVLNTTDGGTSWTTQSSNTSWRLHEVSFLDGTTGIAAGESGTVIATNDAGQTWTVQDGGTTQHLNAGSFAATNRAYVVGDNGTILRGDGPNIWQTQSIDTSLAFVDVYFMNRDSGSAVGWDGVIYETTTGGDPPPSQDPIAYWPFNGNADDESGNGNDGDVVGASLTNDRFGNPESAYEFDGIDDYIGYPALWLNSPGSVTMVAWFKQPVVGDGTILYHGDNGEIGLTVLNGEARAAAKLTNFLWYETAGGVVLADNWHFIAAVWDKDNNLTLSLDGEDVQSIPVPDLFLFDPGTGFPASIGANSQNMQGTPFGGTIDDIRVYERALSQEEILDLYNETSLDPLAQYNVCYGTTGSPDSANAGALITIDPITGAGTLVGLTGIPGSGGSAVPAVAIKSTGEMYALSQTPSSDLYTVNASTGAGTFVANTGLLFPGAILFDRNDVLYAVDETENLYTVDEATGVRSVVGPTGVLLRGLAYDPTDGTIYGSGSDGNVYTINESTGLATLVGATGLGGNLPDIHFDQGGSLFGTMRGVGNDYDYISIDKTTGAGTIIGSTGFWAVIGLATRLDPPAAIPCGDISRFQSRCQPGGTIQARLILATGDYEGEAVEFTIDDTLTYSVTVNSNMRASLSVGIFAAGNHTVALTDPPGCFDPITVRCGQGVAMDGDFWNDEESREIPATTSLFDNYPNPFNPSTTIRYGLSEDSYVTLRVYNMLGQLVKTLADDFQLAGYNELVWDGRNQHGSNVASGLYLFRMTAGNYVETRKMLLMK